MFFIQYHLKLDNGFPIQMHGFEREYEMLINLYDQEVLYKFYQEGKTQPFTFSNLSEKACQTLAKYPSLQVHCHFVIDGENLEALFSVYREKLEQLIENVSNRVIVYDEEDPSTWLDTFVKINYQNKEIRFSYDTPEGELLWGLSHTLPCLEEEIALQGGIVAVFLVDQPSQLTDASL